MACISPEGTRITLLSQGQEGVLDLYISICENYLPRELAVELEESVCTWGIMSGNGETGRKDGDLGGEPA